MSGNDLDRLRADLAVMRGALGMDLAWSAADTRFMGLIAAAAGMYALLSWPGTAFEITSAWAAAPLWTALAAYLVFMAARSRSLSARESTRRSEYRSAIIAAACVVPATIAAVIWCKHLGMTGTQLRAVPLAFMAVAFLAVGVAAPPVRYPRGLFLIGAVPLVAFAILIPLAPPQHSHSLIGLMGLVECGLAAMIFHRGLKRHLAESGTHGDN